MKKSETFKLISIEETIKLVRSLETDFARTEEESDLFLEYSLGIELLGVLKDTDTYYVITNDGDFYWLWVTSNLSDHYSGASSNGNLKTFSENYGLPMHHLIEMVNRWN